jgi:hypothetical protein
LKIKKYTIEVTEGDNGKNHLRRTNDGFTAIELLGILWEAQHDIINQIRGKKQKFTTIKRQVVEKEK